MVRMTFRELWAKGSNEKIIWLCAVQIAWGEEVDGGERFRVQRLKRLRDQKCGNINITNPTVRRAYNNKAIIIGRIEQKNIINRCA